MVNKNQSDRLTSQHKESQGSVGIFGEESQEHDSAVSSTSRKVIENLSQKYPALTFRHRKFISKEEINEALQRLDAELGQTLFLSNASIKPDGGIIEVQDVYQNWRVILVSEAKHQGKDIENIRAGKMVGKYNNQDLMLAGNAIERSHKNISEIANFMLSELHFPYLVFLSGSNFLTETISVERPDSRVVELAYDSGTLNRLDRLTAANYGMPLNKNLCRNKFIKRGQQSLMLQAASIYTTGNGKSWDVKDMLNIMLEIAETSLNVLREDLSGQKARI